MSWYLAPRVPPEAFRSVLTGRRLHARVYTYKGVTVTWFIVILFVYHSAAVRRCPTSVCLPIVRDSSITSRYSVVTRMYGWYRNRSYNRKPRSARRRKQFFNNLHKGVKTLKKNTKILLFSCHWTLPHPPIKRKIWANFWKFTSRARVE